MKTLNVLLLLICSTVITAQESKKMTLPYSKIPEAQTNYSAGNILARFIDGLGYRYYWSTEGLTEADFNYKISEDSRNTMETLLHLHGLAESILNVSEIKPNIRPYKTPQLSFKKLRKETLENLQKASELFQGKNETEIEALKIIYEIQGKRSDFPLWNLINGQLSDAVYHVGQVVASRRASGNPMNPKVNVFTGKTGE